MANTMKILDAREALGRLLSAANGVKVYPYHVGEYTLSQGDDAITLRSVIEMLEQSQPVQEQHKEEHEIYYHCGHSVTLTFTGTNEEIATYIRGHEARDCPACFAEKHPFATFVNVNIDDDSKEEDDED